MTGFLEGRLALVTGASRGIGAAIAEALAGEGAHVILTARTAAGLEAAEEAIHAAGGSATIAPLDLTAPDGIAKLAQAVAGRWQALDLLVLNAAMLGTLTPVAQIDGKEFNKVLTLNLLAQQALIAAFDPMLRQSEAASVLAVRSNGAIVDEPPAPWIQSSTASRSAALRAARTTCAPSAASASAIAAPMPRLAPVTSASFPSSRPGIRRSVRPE